MNDKTLACELIKAIPELEEEYYRTIKLYGEEFPGNHNIFCDIFNPWIMKLLEENSDEKLIVKAMDFLNRMAECEDCSVVNVLQVSVLERIGDVSESLKIAKKYLNIEAIKLSDEIEKAWGRMFNVTNK